MGRLGSAQAVVDLQGVMSPHWLVIQTGTGKERRTCRNLRQSGFEVYLPQRPSFTKAGVNMVAWFPRYLMTRLTIDVERWQVLWSTDGVDQVMGGRGHRLIGLRDDVVRAIRYEELENYKRLGVAPGVPTCDLAPLEPVMISGFMPGKFIGVDGRRVTVLLSLLSGDSRVTVDLSRVTRA